jgi:predicted RNase H-like HicB family nuclease
MNKVWWKVKRDQRRRQRRLERSMESLLEGILRPYHRVLMSEGDNWVGTIVEFPGCIVFGKTVVEAVVDLEVVARNWVREMMSNGREIPNPEHLK